VAKRIGLLALIVALCGGAQLAAVRADAVQTRVPASKIIRSTVRAFVVDCKLKKAPDGDPMGVPVTDSCQALGSGSGTIIRQDGWILTNAHVALNEQSGQPQWLLIAITTDPRELPTAAFFARAIVYDANVDLAIIKPTYALDGRPIQEGDVNLLPLPMAKKDKSVQLEQSLRLIGYPAVGGSTVTIDPAVVSGFGLDDRVPELGGSAWIKTDPSGGAGISGGSEVDDSGILVGVPSAGGLAEIRCVDANGDGKIDPATECAATGGESGFSRPIPEAYNLLLQKARQAGQIDSAGNPVGTTPTPGTQTPNPPADGVVITGTVVSAETGNAIASASVLVFKPGVTVKQAIDAQDPANTYSWGKSDSRGRFILNNPVARNQGYGVLVFASGYGSVGGDGIVLAKDSDPATTDIGTIKLPAAQ
jgi:hypothetical protein